MAKYEGRITARVEAETETRFTARCEEYGVDQADMLRELLTAFNEKRIIINVPETQVKILKGVHSVLRTNS